MSFLRNIHCVGNYKKLLQYVCCISLFTVAQNLTFTLFRKINSIKKASKVYVYKNQKTSPSDKKENK